MAEEEGEGHHSVLVLFDYIGAQESFKTAVPLVS
jgi:hypothetical protein